MLWNSREILALWNKWNNNQFTKLLIVDQMSIDNNIVIEFAINIKSNQFYTFLKNLNEIVIKKIPNGTLSFISYLSQVSDNDNKYYINTQYKKYRIEFIDSSLKYSEKNDIKEKSIIFYNKLLEII